MAASNDRNKITAGGAFGDADPTAYTEPDNAYDVAHDGAGIPQVGMTNNNKFDWSPSALGDNNPTMFADNDQLADVTHDGAGAPAINQGEKTDMALTLEPNRFPRQTGHDSLSPEEAQLS